MHRPRQRSCQPRRRYLVPPVPAPYTLIPLTPLSSSQDFAEFCESELGRNQELLSKMMSSAGMEVSPPPSSQSIVCCCCCLSDPFAFPHPLMNGYLSRQPNVLTSLRGLRRRRRVSRERRASQIPPVLWLCLPRSSPTSPPPPRGGRSSRKSTKSTGGCWKATVTGPSHHTPCRR